MYVFELNKDKIHKCIEENENVFVCYYDKDCLVSGFMKGMFNCLKNKINKDAVFIVSEKDNDLEIKDEYPKINVYHNQKLIYSFKGFMSYKKILKEIA